VYRLLGASVGVLGVGDGMEMATARNSAAEGNGRRQGWRRCGEAARCSISVVGAIYGGNAMQCNAMGGAALSDTLYSGDRRAQCDVGADDARCSFASNSSTPPPRLVLPGPVALP
jgi:hypothetical protein